MKILFIGSIHFSKHMLEKLISLNEDVVGVCAVKESNFNADHCDLGEVGTQHGLPVHYVTDINSPDTVDWMASKSPDIIFCFGWSKLLKSDVLSLAPMGVLGFHPTMLPANRGRHPLIWALALGLNTTASTFFFMDAGADSGDILSQEKIAILPADDAGTMYSKVISTALQQVQGFLPKLKTGTFRRIPQALANGNVWRKRGKADGRIDWRMDAVTIHNLVRALTRPYVGAHFEYSGHDIKVWKTEVVATTSVNLEPGKVIDLSKGQFPVVKCGSQAIRLIEYELVTNLEVGTYL